MAELSIIIPTLDAEVELQDSLPPLAAFDALNLVREVIFADGGSRDRTAAVAEASGARLVVAETGRGQQLAAGAAVARGPWLLFLHADTCLDPHWQEVVSAFIHNPDNGRRAGYFRFKLDDRRKRAWILERLVALRAHVLGLPYGDQGLLISRDFYRELGGFKPLPLMEDVDIVRRIGRSRLTALAAAAVTSAARYRRGGYVLRPIRNLCCLALFFLGAPARLIAKLYA